MAVTIPLAANIAHAGELTSKKPKSFRGKYGTAFGKIYEDVCEEIMERLQALETERAPRPARKAKSLATT